MKLKNQLLKHLRVFPKVQDIEKMTPPQTWLLRWGMKLKRHHPYLIERYHQFSSQKGQQILDQANLRLVCYGQRKEL
jgi:hypothetical protein